MSSPELDILERVVQLITGSNGLAVFVAIVAYAFFTGKIVLGSVYDECRQDLRSRIDKAEAELDLWRRERQRSGAD